MVPILFQAGLHGIWVLSRELYLMNKEIPYWSDLALAFGLFFIGFVVTQGLILLSFRRKWELKGYRKIVLGCLFPGVIQATAGRLVWGSALNFALLVTPFVASWFCTIGALYLIGDLYDWYGSYNFCGRLLYGFGFFAVLSPLWLPLYLLNVWEVCRIPEEVRIRAGRTLLTFLLSLSFPGLGTAYVGQRRYWGYALFSFGAIFVLFLLDFMTLLSLGSMDYPFFLISLTLLSGYLALPLVSLIDWYFSCLRSAAQDVKKP